MAVTQNTYTGNGSTVLYSFTFPYLETTDIKVSVNGTTTTAYTLANATTIQFNTAPANGAAIRIYRETDDTGVASTFFAGSAIRAQDLNSNFTQNLYVTQESKREANTAVSTANTALGNSNTAISTANSAVSTANSAVSTANSAVSTANTASTNASAAVSTANTASSNASTAVSTANAASATAASAVTTANSAVSTANGAVSTANAANSTANSALTAANSAVSTANTASTNASNAVSTANTANTNASTAVSTANTASTNASTAVSTANTANTKADQAIAAVSNSINFQLKANVAAIPSSPANDTYIEVQDSTGLESFTPLAGKPAGFVGDAGLSVRLRYTTAGTTWNWLNYYANDSDARFLKKTGGTMTGKITLDGNPSANLHPATKQYVDAADATLTSAAAAAQSTANTAVTNAAAAQSTANTAVTNAAAAQATADAALPKAGGTATGNISAPAFIPTGGTAPTNGVFLAAPNSVAISTNGTGRLFVDSSGRVGVGDSSPSARLVCNGSIQVTSSTNPTTGAGLEIGYGTVNASRTALQSYNRTGSAWLGADYNALDHRFYISGGGSPQMTLTSTGLGIGTTSPGRLLQVSNTSADPFVSILGAASNNGGLLFGDNASDAVGQIRYDHSADAMYFATNSSERFRCDSSGRLLVGTTTGSSLLTVAGGATISGDVNLTSGTQANPGYIYVGGGADSSDVYLRAGSSAGVWSAVRIVGNWSGSGNTGGQVGFFTAGTERMRITNGGSMLLGATSQTYGPSLGYMLAVRANTGNQTYLSIAAPGQTPDGAGMVFGIDTGSANLIVRDNKPLTFNTNDIPRMTIAAGGSVSIVGALSKGSGSFRIDHPLPEKKDTHQLVHSFIEGPQADLIYRGHVCLVNGKAFVNIDEAARMTEGTFEALCRDVCCFTTNESDWTPVRGSVSGNILTIEAQDPTSTADVCWLVIGERKDQHMLDTDWTDETGRVITEPVKNKSIPQAA